VERLGVDRARARAAAADLRLFLILPGEPPPELERMPDDLWVWGKADLGDGAMAEGQLAVSGLTGAGIDGLLARIGTILSGKVAGAGLVVRARHRAALQRARAALDRFGAEAAHDRRAELAAEELREAIRAMDSLVGRVDVEHILGEIFSSFCIGK
jgi:tRNA modification GTPase